MRGISAKYPHLHLFYRSHVDPGNPPLVPLGTSIILPIGPSTSVGFGSFFRYSMLFRNHGVPHNLHMFPFIRNFLMRRLMLRSSNTTLSMNHATFCKFMPNLLKMVAAPSRLCLMKTCM